VRPKFFVIHDGSVPLDKIDSEDRRLASNRQDEVPFEPKELMMLPLGHESQ
jgi:hypothetical protein